MLLAKNFDLFRKQKTGKIWTYKNTKEFTAPCKIEPIDLNIGVWLEDQAALESWKLHTETLNIQVEDMVVIDNVQYVVSSTKKYQGILKNNCVSLLKKKYD